MTSTDSQWATDYRCTDTGDWNPMQGHADYCAAHGHATYTRVDENGNADVAGWCPRCGELFTLEVKMTTAGHVMNANEKSERRAANRQAGRLNRDRVRFEYATVDGNARFFSRGQVKELMPYARPVGIKFRAVCIDSVLPEWVDGWYFIGTPERVLSMWGDITGPAILNGTAREFTCKRSPRGLWVRENF